MRLRGQPVEGWRRTSGHATSPDEQLLIEELAFGEEDATRVRAHLRAQAQRAINLAITLEGRADGVLRGRELRDELDNVVKELREVLTEMGCRDLKFARARVEDPPDEQPETVSHDEAGGKKPVRWR
jgi:hypothetical protein